MTEPGSSEDDHLSGWADTLGAAIVGTIVDRVMVLEETLSTQDAASRACAGLGRDHPGVLVVAGRQLKGRGQRGQHWQDGRGDTLPCSIGIGRELLGLDNASIAARAGLAALDAAGSMLPDARIRIKWPNDVYASATDDDPFRKLAGVLVEHAGDSVIIGIGINCTQHESDWSPDIRDSAVSFRILGGRTSRLELACRLIAAFDDWFGGSESRASDERVRAHWAAHDALTGSQATLIRNNQTITGTIINIDPLNAIRVQTNTGEVSLPVAQTRLVESKFST